MTWVHWALTGGTILIFVIVGGAYLVCVWQGEREVAREERMPKPSSAPSGNLGHARATLRRALTDPPPPLIVSAAVGICAGALAFGFWHGLLLGGIAGSVDALELQTKQAGEVMHQVQAAAQRLELAATDPFLQALRASLTQQQQSLATLHSQTQTLLDGRTPDQQWMAALIRRLRALEEAQAEAKQSP